MGRGYILIFFSHFPERSRPSVHKAAGKKARREVILMKQYEYKFIQVPVAWNTQGIISRPPKAGSTFDACKDVIENEAANGVWGPPSAIR